MLSQLCFQTAFLVASAHSVFLVHALDSFCIAVRCTLPRIYFPEPMGACAMAACDGCSSVLSVCRNTASWALKEPCVAAQMVTSSMLM